MIRIKNAVRRAAMMGVAVVCVTAFSRAGTGDVAFDTYVAERMALIADQISILSDTPPAGLKQSAALLDLAMEMNPNEIRFARQLTDICLRLGDRDRAIQALTAVRRIEPADQVAMIQYIDLVTSKMETAEAKIAYLTQVVDARGVAPEVQSHAAYKLVDLYYSRAQDSDAEESLKKALQLNPQNVPALKLKYQLAVRSGVAKDRVAALAELMRWSPTDTEGMLALAHEADAVGNYDASGLMRLYALQVNASRGVPPSIDEAINFTGTQMLSGHDDAVKGILTQLIEPMKNDGRVYTLSLLYLQLTGEQVKEDAVPMARGVYLAQLAGVSQLLNDPDKKEMPTTNPAVPMPNVRSDVEKIKAGDPNNLGAAYAVALTEQLWFDLFFKAAEVDDANIEALGQLLGADDPILVRLQGWKLLNAGKIDEALVKLEAVADRDGFARLGMIIAAANTNQADKARQEMTRLLRERPTGMIAAYTSVLAKKMAAVVDPTPEEQAIGDIIVRAQRHIGDVLSNPRAFYLLTASPDKVAYQFGEPIIAVVTLLNNGQMPITVGPGGLVEPTFVIDAQVRTTPPQVFPGTAQGMFTGVVKLKPGQKISQTVRLDRDQLFRFLQGYSTPLFPITAYVTTNAVPEGHAGWRSGAGGQQTKLGKAFERQSSPLYVESYRTKMLDRIANGTVLERATSAELCGTIIGPMKQQTDNAESQTLAETLEKALDAELANEANPELKAWIQLSYRKDLPEEEWIKMLAGSRTTIGQLGAMVSARLKDKAMREETARLVLSSDPVPPVAEFAQALLVQPDIKVPEQHEEDLPDTTR